MTLMRKNFLIGLFCGVVMSASGCQTASLEDAAPAGASTPSGPSAATQMGLPTVVPSARPIPPTADFVASGARRTGEYPQFKTLEAANTQLTPEQKKAAENEMAGLLRARAATPSSQMTYAQRLAYLRKVAANHGDEAEAEIAK